jgi:hypothetical protein
VGWSVVAATQVQSYGNFVKRGLKADNPRPGVACNGHLNPHGLG